MVKFEYIQSEYKQRRRRINRDEREKGSEKKSPSSNCELRTQPYLSLETI